MSLFFMAITVDGVELSVNWSADQSVDPTATTPPVSAEKPNFTAMKKAELVEYLSPDGSDVDTTLTKAELIKLAEALYPARG